MTLLPKLFLSTFFPTALCNKIVAGFSAASLYIMYK